VLLASYMAERHPVTKCILCIAKKGVSVLLCRAGAAGDALLGSYTAERRPVALANTALSVANYWDAVRLPQALGLDPRAAAALSKVAAASPLPGLSKMGRCLPRPGGPLVRRES
jgi:hypothetical protein